MSNCFFNGDFTTLEDLMAANPSLARYVHSLPQGVQQVLQENHDVIQSPAALVSFAQKLVRDGWEDVHPPENFGTFR